MNTKNSVIIVASGNATRMQNVTQNCYPKILTNVGQETVLDKILNTVAISTDIHLILASELQVKQVQQYLKVVYDSHFDDIITFHVTENSLSSSDSIRRHLEKLPNAALIMWSDIWLSENIVEMPVENTIFCDNNSRHRYKFNAKLNSISPAKDDGNICGIYFVEDIKKMLKNALHDDVDFVSYLSHSTYVNNRFNAINVDVNDVGDESKYSNYLRRLPKDALSTRYFNCLTITEDNLLRKKATTLNGRQVLDNEVNWYKNYHKNCDYISTFTDIKKVVPQIENVNYQNGSFDMTYYENALQLKDVPAYATEAIDALKHIHNLGQTESNRRSMTKEYIDVPKQRFESIYSILPKLTIVNGLEISPQILIRSNLVIEKYIEESSVFNIIHGDPNSSNVLIHDNEIVLIDPRGIFGDTQFYGDANYDFAKLIYGLTGYDDFNQTKDLRFELNNSIIEFDSKIKFEAIEQLVTKYKLDKIVILLVGLIWFKLPSYTINNLNKSIVAYATSLQLIQLYLNTYDKNQKS